VSLSPFVKNFLQPLLIHGLADVVIHTLSGREKADEERKKGKMSHFANIDARRERVRE
jgi:hypothetical protein